MRRLALLLSVLAAPALGQGTTAGEPAGPVTGGGRGGSAGVSRAAAPLPTGLYPQISGEADVRIFLQGVTSGDRRERGTNIFTRAEVSTGLFLAPNLSVQSVIHVEPVGEVQPNGGVTAFRYTAAYLEELRLDYRPVDGLLLYGGKFSAPFGRGHHDFPGLLLDVRAHETYLIRESLGAGFTYTYLDDPRFGTHDLSAALFTFDTSFLSETAFTRKRCCEGEFERFSRNSRQQGGPGNNGRLNNFAVSLDGDNMPFLPNTSYHLAYLSRAPGRDGDRREHAFAAGLRHEIRWRDDLRTLLFAEYVHFRNSGGNPREAGPELLDEFGEGTGAFEDVTVRERRQFTTLGARTQWGPWRATVGYQQDVRKRSENTVPRASYLELSVGRDLPFNFRLDVGYQRAVAGNRSDAVIGVLGWRATF